MAGIKFKSKTIDLKDICLFCLDRIAKYSVPSGYISEDYLEGYSVPDFSTVCKYLQINLASSQQLEDATFSSLTKCDKFLCLGCFELVTEIGQLYGKLEEVNAQIEEATGKARNVIVEHCIDLEEGQRRKESEEKLEGNGEGRRTRGRGGRECVEFVEAFQNLVKFPERTTKHGQLDLDDKVTRNQDEVKLIEKDDIRVDKVEIVNSNTDQRHQAKRTSKTKKQGGRKRPISRRSRKQKLLSNLKARVDVKTKEAKIEFNLVEGEDGECFEDLDTEGHNFSLYETEDITDIPVPSPSGHREASSLHKTKTQEGASPLPARTFKVKIEVKHAGNEIDKVKIENELEEVASEKDGDNTDSDPDYLDSEDEDEWFPWRNKVSKDFGPRKLFQPVKPKPKKCLEVTKRILRKRLRAIKRDYKCVECKQVLISSSQYISHYRRQHAEEVISRIQIPTTVLTNPDESKKDRQLLQCLLCDYQTLSKLSDFRYYEHMLSHEEDAKFQETSEPYGCDACDKVFILKINHLLHKMFVHDPRREVLKCELCCVKIFGREEFIEHLKLHSETVYSCTSCPMSCMDMPTLLDHMSMHAGRKRLTCPACDHLVVFPSYHELIGHCKVAHEEIVKMFDCPQCNKSYITPKALSVHIYRLHSCVAPPNNISSNCDEGNVTSNASLDKQIPLQHKKKTYGVHCDKCEKTFPTRRTLQEHIQVVHENTPFLCPHCPSTFTRESSFKNHLKMHTGDNLVQCLVCGKKLPTNGRLRRHMKSTHEKATVICEICGKECVNQLKLKKHMKIHGEKKYDCPHCDFKFKREDHLRHHLRTHSGERPFVCKVCGKGFNRRDIMRIHWRVHGLSSTLTPEEEEALQTEAKSS